MSAKCSRRSSLRFDVSRDGADNRFLERLRLSVAAARQVVHEDRKGDDAVITGAEIAAEGADADDVSAFGKDAPAKIGQAEAIVEGAVAATDGQGIHEKLAVLAVVLVAEDGGEGVGTEAVFAGE